MAKNLDWKTRWLIMVAGIVIMMLGQSSLLLILTGMTVALFGIYYGTKDAFLAYLKRLLVRIWVYIRDFLLPF